MTKNLKVYQIACPSICGTYFTAYLQYVTVVASDKEEALSITKKWLEGSEEKFILPEKDWVIEELGSAEKPSVVYWHMDSDY